MTHRSLLGWLYRLMFLAAILIALVLFLVLPVAGSFLITNNHFHFPERGPTTPEAVGISVLPAEFVSQDGIPLRGWWIPGDRSMPVIILVHGLNRSRLEMLERGADASRRGYGVLLFDLRNHGESGRAYTTIGVFESRDVCAASGFVKSKAVERQQILWGVSMGASSAILAAKQCPGFSAIISDSSFLSFRETVDHHLRLILRLPAFPVANLIVAITSYRKAAVHSMKTPILFIAGGRDRRMPPALAEKMFKESPSVVKELLIIPTARHGEAFATDRTTYLNSVYGFLERVRDNAVPK